MNIKVVFIFLLSILIYSQNMNGQSSALKIPDYYQLDETLSDSLFSIVKIVGLDGKYNAGEDGIETISFAVIDLNSNPAKLGGVYFDNFIYLQAFIKCTLLLPF